MDKVLIATRIDEKTHRRLQEIGGKDDRTVAYLVRKAVEEYVEAKRRGDRRKEG